MGDISNSDDLIRRAQDGDVHAFELLVEAQIPRLRRFARSFAHNDADADDLAQEALIKVYRSLRSYRFESAFTTWLYRVIKNCFMDAQRSADPQRVLALAKRGSDRRRLIGQDLDRGLRRTPTKGDVAAKGGERRLNGGGRCDDGLQLPGIANHDDAPRSPDRPGGGLRRGLTGFVDKQPAKGFGAQVAKQRGDGGERR